ncbi:hypothetical protein [Agrobacterium sp. ST15.13.015]|uniref:hypothetical protein n=1 Tax=Agrobacterium sp. ST15.13.015 TaxID=3017319 RepID=UPI0022CCD7A6|nr:hypothetical protein [Agrobacterium sp. ST15.13.015]MCZ7502702.1 hypothetical protein [Rhizobium rhizogenes]
MAGTQKSLTKSLKREVEGHQVIENELVILFQKHEQKQRKQGKKISTSASFTKSMMIFASG